ncbi:EF0163 family protein [Enterococcus rotai]|uniref:EF0163 family protein n=1 Tax=Enterococcus rotai TaxID=118060 RepID=UPI0032B623A9
MKKIILTFVAVLFIVGLTACKQEKKEMKTTETATLEMKQVEGIENGSHVSSESKETKDSSVTSKKESVDTKKLLNDFGEAYANYDNITDRNSKLKKVMTDKCIKMNGINFDSAVMLASRGEVVSIYQPIDGEKDQYAILLNCQQNGSEVRVLLLVKVTGSKISEMTYNTVKQEY